MNTVQRIIKTLLRRNLFPGQYRLFGKLFTKGVLDTGLVRVKPLKGNFTIECDTRTWIGSSVVYMGDYEPATKAAFKQLVQPGDTVLDIGANIGLHTLYLSELAGKNGKVIAIEPVKVNFNCLLSNIKLNDYCNILPIEKALGDKNETLGIHADPDSNNPGAYSLLEKGNLLIDMVRGDELLAEVDKLDLIKIDVEGYELPALKGLEKTLTRLGPTIIFEYDSQYQFRSGNETALFTFLEQFGYRFLKITRKGLVPFEYHAGIRSAQLCAIKEKHA